MISTENGRAKAPAQKKSSSAGRQSGTRNANSNWVRTFAASADALEEKIALVLSERPAMALGCAVGLGIAGYLLLKKLPRPAHPARGGKKGSTRSANSTGILSAGLVPALTRFQSEFDKIAIDGIAGVKENVVEMISNDFSERPLQTLGVAISLGYGLGGLQTEDLKRGALRFAKLLAVNSIDGGVPSNNPIQIGEKNEQDDEYEQERH